jgi:purine nucleosidase
MRLPICSVSERFDLKKYEWDGAPLHDPCVIAWLLWPEIFVHRHINVTMEISSPLTYGMTVADWWHVTDRPRNVTFLRDLNSDLFYERLTRRLATLP